jgi:hypothetical protein
MLQGITGMIAIPSALSNRIKDDRPDQIKILPWKFLVVATNNANAITAVELTASPLGWCLKSRLFYRGAIVPV